MTASRRKPLGLMAPLSIATRPAMMKESLFAAEEREAMLDKLGDVLQRLDEHVDFATLAAKIDRVAPCPAAERGGCPPFPTEFMVRALTLQKLYSLDDGQMEFQLLDRLSFQRFVGLRHCSQIPDRSRFRAFRERLMAAGVTDAISAAVNRELSRQGYLARGGRIIDASLVPLPVPNHQEAPEPAKQQALPSGQPDCVKKAPPSPGTASLKRVRLLINLK